MLALQISSQEQFVQYIKENSIGNRALSVRGLAALCNVHESSLREACGVETHKIAGKLAGKGLSPAGAIESGFSAQAAWLVVEYFAFESKAKAEGAKHLARLFGSLGIQKCFEMAHGTPVVQPVPQQLPPVRDYIEHLEATDKIARLSNPILRSYFEQAQMEALSSALALPPTEDDLVLAAVLARDMGFALKPGQDAQLGKFVRQHHDPKGQAQHGRYMVNVYSKREITDTVQAFFR